MDDVERAGPTAETPPLLRTLLEAIAVQMGMDSGRWRGEFVFADGKLLTWFRHEEKVPAAALGRFEPSQP